MVCSTHRFTCPPLLQAFTVCFPKIHFKDLGNVAMLSHLHSKLCRHTSAHIFQHVQVGQALSLSSGIPAPWETTPAPPAHIMHSASGAGGLSIEFAQQQILQQQAAVAAAAAAAAAAEGQQQARVFLCTKDDSLRTVVERLAIPGVRRLIVVHPDSRRVEGIVSLSDVAAYLFL